MLFHYWIWLKNKKGKTYIFEDMVPWVIPQFRIEQTLDQFVEELGICKNCDGTICHVIEKSTGRKFCPILFHDLVKPKWKLNQLP
jgi:hypothetical protein